MSGMRIEWVAYKRVVTRYPTQMTKLNMELLQCIMEQMNAKK